MAVSRQGPAHIGGADNAAGCPAAAHPDIAEGAQRQRQLRGAQVVYQFRVLQAADAMVYPLHLRVTEAESAPGVQLVPSPCIIQLRRNQCAVAQSRCD